MAPSTHTADDYSLFSLPVSPGAPTRDEVAIDLNAALDDSIRTGDIAYIEHELWYHRRHGSDDSEARNFAFRRYHEGHGVDVTGRTYHSPDSYSFV